MPIIDWVNVVFGQHIKEQGVLQPAYEPLAPVRQEATAGPPVSVVGVEPHQDGDKSMLMSAVRRIEAVDVVAAIRTAIHESWTTQDESWESRPLRKRDITILIPARKFQLLALDQSNGHVLLSNLNGDSICFVGAGYLATVDLDTSVVKQAAANGCTGALDDNDNDAGTAELLTYRSFSVNIQGASILLPVNELKSAVGAGSTVRQQYPLTMVVDGINHVALVAYMSPAGHATSVGTACWTTTRRVNLPK